MCLCLSVLIPLSCTLFRLTDEAERQKNDEKTDHSMHRGTFVFNHYLTTTELQRIGLQKLQTTV